MSRSLKMYAMFYDRKIIHMNPGSTIQQCFRIKNLAEHESSKIRIRAFTANADLLLFDFNCEWGIITSIVESEGRPALSATPLPTHWQTLARVGCARDTLV